MSTLLVQSCSKSKIETDEPVQAIELYSGYFFKIIKKSRREARRKPNLDICILSAKYGIVDPDESISPYDRRMDADRAKELAPKVRAELRHRITRNQYERVVINVGRDYEKALHGFNNGLDVETTFIRGEGIGAKGSVLKRFLHGDESAIEKVA